MDFAGKRRSDCKFLARLVLPAEMVEVAERIVEMKRADFDPALLEDRYRTVLVSMLRDKQAKLPQKAEVVAPKLQNVVNLMDVLKRSLSAEKPAGGSSLPKPTPRRIPSASKGMSSRRPKPRARKAS